MKTNPLLDTLNRPIHDLRISVIDRCNFRCPYCMPEEEYAKHYEFLKEKDWLTFPEIVKLTKIFVQCGVSKVRLTGGEPLLRADLPNLIRDLNTIQGIEDLALTTNGSLLAKFAPELKEAGLRRLTVSLDTLDSRVFKKMSGEKGSLQKVLNGIKEAERHGFQSIKINVVIQKGVNDHTLMDLIEYFRGTQHVLRFIEYMDVGNCNHWQDDYVVPSREILKLINKKYRLKALDKDYFGEVAERYSFEDGGGEVGFIASVTQPFCQSCTRARLSADGKLYTCLFASEGRDLKALLRQRASHEELLNLIKSIWQKRGDRYSELRASTQHSQNEIPKVEMFQIGG